MPPEPMRPEAQQPVGIEVRSERELTDAERIKKFLEEFGLDDSAVRQRVVESDTYEQEVVRRSAKNVRATLEAYLQVETQEGWVDFATREAEAMEQWRTVVIPLLEQLFQQARVSESVNDLFTTPDRFKRPPDRREILERIWVALSTRVTSRSTPRPVQDWDTNEGPIEQLAHLTTDAEKGGLDQTFLTHANNVLAKFFTDTEQALTEKHRHRLTTEATLNELRAETLLVATSSEITINIPTEKMQKIIESGECIGLLDLPEEQRHERVKAFFDKEHYLTHRAMTEKILRPSDPTLTNRGKATVYGAFAAGSERRTGGAPRYGEIFLRLKPNVMKRTTFTEGDSTSNAAWSRAVAKKLPFSEADATNVSRRQIHAHDAPLAKAMLNIDRKRRKQYGLPSPPVDFGYLEAHIFGGVRSEDIERVIVPRPTLATTDLGSVSEQTKVLEQLQADTAWRDKVEIVE